MVCGKFDRFTLTRRRWGSKVRSPPPQVRLIVLRSTSRRTTLLRRAAANVGDRLRGVPLEVLPQQLEHAAGVLQGGVGVRPVAGGAGAHLAVAVGAVLALTVEYRYLPIYQRGEEPAEKPDK